MAAPIERLPGEVVARMFYFVDPKTLMMTIPSVSHSGRTRDLGHVEVLGQVLGFVAGLHVAVHRKVWDVGAKGGSVCCGLNTVLRHWVGVFWWPRAGLHGVAASLLRAHGTDPA